MPSAVTLTDIRAANIKVIEKGLQGLIEARPLSRRNVDLIDSEEEI